MAESYFVWVVEDDVGYYSGLKKLIDAYELKKRVRANSSNCYFRGPGFPVKGHKLEHPTVVLQYLRMLLSMLGDGRLESFVLCGNAPLESVVDALVCVGDVLDGINKCMHGRDCPSFRHPAMDQCMMDIVEGEARGEFSPFLCGVVVCRNKGWGESRPQWLGAGLASRGWYVEYPRGYIS